MLLLAGQRGQTIHMFDVRNMHLTFSVVKFTVGDLLKTSRPGVHTGQVVFRAYTPDRRLCVVTVLKEYLQILEEGNETVIDLHQADKGCIKGHHKEVDKRHFGGCWH